MDKTNPDLRRRIEGLVKAIGEEMQPGPREFALGAVSDLIDERDALYRKQDELEAEVEQLRAAGRAVIEQADIPHPLSGRDPSVPIEALRELENVLKASSNVR
jgi:hypothetical protein